MEKMEAQHNELGEMRQQMAILQEKLHGQQIINDRLIRESMLDKMSLVRRYNRLMYIALAFVFVAYLGIRADLGLSWWLYAATIATCTVSVGFELKTDRYTDAEFMSGDLVTVSRHLVKMRQQRKKLMVIEYFTLVIWLIWFYAEPYCGFLAKAIDKAELIIMVICGLIGGIIGTILSIKFYQKKQNITDEIIHQIKSLTR